MLYLWYRFGISRRQFVFGVGVLAGFVLTLLVGFSVYRYDMVRSAVCQDTLRLHILANSDSAADQALKLQVRDALLTDMGAILDGAPDKAAAIARVESALPKIAGIARRTLREADSTQKVTVRLEQRQFDAKDYGGFALPAGEYTALRVELGAAAGHNWFCVLYPELCVGAAGGRYETPAENALVFGDYEVRFALADTVRDWWQGRQRETGRTATPESAQRER